VSDLTRGSIEELLAAVGDHLEDAGATASVVVVGGAALNVLGCVERSTRDVDIIAMGASTGDTRQLLPPDPLPPELKDAIARVARDFGLASGWMNTEVARQ
jgi:hypothetical protein